MHPGCHAYADDARPEMACRGRQVPRTRCGVGKIRSAVVENDAVAFASTARTGRVQCRSSTTAGASQSTTEFPSNAE